MKRILLHICCGPCATHVIETLATDHEVTGYFFNPNIHPPAEYLRRLRAAEEVCARFGVRFIEEMPDFTVFREAVRGLEEEPENGARCPVCIRLRLGKAAEAAARGKFDTLASTLTVGPMKKAAVINPIGIEEAGKYGERFMEADWKKGDGFRRSCEISRDFNIHRQHYCGCEFSFRGPTSGACGKPGAQVIGEKKGGSL